MAPSLHVMRDVLASDAFDAGALSCCSAAIEERLEAVARESVEKERLVRMPVSRRKVRRR